MQKVYPELVKRLEHIRQLQHNWDSYGSRGFQDDTVELAYSVIQDMKYAAEQMGVQLPQPEVFPGPEGVIQFEWTINGKAFELSFALKEGTPNYEYLLCPEENPDSWEEGEFTGPLAESSAISKFLSWI